MAPLIGLACTDPVRVRPAEPSSTVGASYHSVEYYLGSYVNVAVVIGRVGEVPTQPTQTFRYPTIGAELDYGITHDEYEYYTAPFELEQVVVIKGLDCVRTLDEGHLRFDFLSHTAQVFPRYLDAAGNDVPIPDGLKTLLGYYDRHTDQTLVTGERILAITGNCQTSQCSIERCTNPVLWKGRISADNRLVMSFEGRVKEMSLEEAVNIITEHKYVRNNPDTRLFPEVGPAQAPR